MKDKRKFYINGEWVDPISTHDYQVINPANEEPCAIVSFGSDHDVNRAVGAAKEAFPAWSVTPSEKRIDLVEQLLEAYKDRAQDFGEAMSIEMGAPIDFAKTKQFERGIINMKGLIEAAKCFKFEEDFDPARPDLRNFYEAHGVCALITPWNWPINQISLKVPAAALAGCSMVLKPSEESPLNAMLFAELIHEVGFPKGVFNLVNGDGRGVGTYLTKHPDIDLVSFTGSTRAGREILRNAADGLKKVSLELGGKGGNIIFSDADKDAVERGVRSVMLNSGQSCDAPTRMIVQREIYDEAVKKAAEVISSIAISAPSEQGDHIGPVVNQKQYDHIQGLIQKGVDEGASLIVGGTGRPNGFKNGYYVKPTLFADAENSMTIAQTEIFGPVLTIIPFDTEDEAIEISNNTVYGLGSYVQTIDGEKANRVARKLRYGMVTMNGVSRVPGQPFGGYKQSGIGREGGRWGLEDFLQLKSVTGWN